jgi:predicted TIM-barrel fold metal-dependent hydrolase
MPIDFHAHWIPSALSDVLRKRTSVPKIRRAEDGFEYYDYSYQSAKLMHGFDDIPTRLAEMDRTGITRAVMSLTTVYGVECMPIQDSLPLCRTFNDAVGAMCKAHPDRFSGLAALPNADLGAALAEFERAMDLPGMVGAIVPGDGFLSKKRAEQFRPIVAAADRRNAILLVHYGRWASDPEALKIDSSDNPGVRYGTLDMQAKLSAGMITFSMTDFLADFPNVTMMVHNLGGNIPYEMERLDHRNMLDTPNIEMPSKRIRASKVMVDCNSFGARGIELAVEIYGAERIVLGTDGTEFGMKWSMDAIAEANISEADRRAILDGNSERVLARVKSGKLAMAA